VAAMMAVGAMSAACAIRTTGTTCTVRSAGAVGERGLEHALQFGGLVAGQLAAGDFAIDEVVDPGFEIAGRRPGAARLVAGPAACTEVSISVSADDRAPRSDELIAPEVTSDCSSACSFWRGDW
jgi:hypothetical protein